MPEDANENLQTEDITAGKAKGRQRRAHTRSRAGCSECRSRRVRCGEQRPQCQNCIKGQRTCEYPPVKIPLRERRALEKATGESPPWQHTTPWEICKEEKRTKAPKKQDLVKQLLLSDSTVNSSCVAVNMPLKSQELFHYFYQTGLTFGAIPKDHTKDSLAFIISDPEALRNAVLIAGIHFAFNVGGLQNFESTFLHHKIETVRLVRKWVSGGDPKLVAGLTKQIATLAYTEICRGDVLLAETHLSIIYTLSNRSWDKEISKHKTSDQELSDRYFLLTSAFIHGLKSVLKGVARAKGQGDDIANLPTTDVVHLLHNFHLHSGKLSHYLKLKAVRLFPAFFTPPYSGAKLLDVDWRPVIKCFGDTTSGVDDYPSSDQQDEFWMYGSSSLFYDSVIMAHLTSISYETYEDGSEASTPEDSSCRTSWCALFIAAQFYVEQVVTLWRPFKKEILLHSLRILQRELTIAMENFGSSPPTDITFWQSFLGLVSVYEHEKEGDMDSEPGFRPFLESTVRRQSRAMGLCTWEDVRGVLSNVLWPSSKVKDWYMSEIWEIAMASGVGSGE